MRNIVNAVLAISLFTGVSYAGVINCSVEPNQSHIAHIYFKSTENSYYPNMTVINSSGSVQRYEASNVGNAISAFGPEEFRTSIFNGFQFAGLATIQYKFFTRPEDENSLGWSSPNGVKMRVILPPAVEIIHLDCVREN